MSKKVYYDESCYVCSFEINLLRKKGEACGIEFIDISSRNFEHSDRDYDAEMVGEFDGKETIGMNTFRALYDSLGYRRFVAFTMLPVIKQLFDLGYYVFAHYVRPILPRKKN